MHQKVLSMILVLVMLLGLLSVSAFTVKDTTSSDSADTSYKYNIMFLDCGRKYYSVDSIEKIIDNASAAGFNYIQLAVGNDGLRFLLDDMSLTVNGTTYISEQVSSAIRAGNEAYYNFDVDELTETEMDTIIAYAASKGMGVIPCVNTPGHMDAILSAANSLTGTTCSYDGSVRTIDVTNATAVAFTQALLQKYINYFAGKGCQLFNMGADEYANDIYTGGAMGFGNLQSAGKYSYYVKYVNKVAKMIEDAQMTPMAFNDGIYFANNTSSGTFDTDIIICYWSNGWPGYSPMSASNLASKGFRLVNTNGSYYWVLGKSDAQCDANKASGFDKDSFSGNSTISNPAGSMFCIWADYPGAETEESVITKTAATIRAFGAALPKVTSGTVTPTPTTPTKPETDAANNEYTISVGSSKTITVSGNCAGNYQMNPANVAAVTTKHQQGAASSISYSATANASIQAYSTNRGRTTYPASNVIDGNTSTMYWSSSEQTKGAYVQVDLGAAIPFDTVRLTSPSGTEDYCTNADVLVSEDGNNWTKIGSYTGNTSTPTAFTNTLDKARYIKVAVTVEKENWWQLSEIEWGNTVNGSFTRMPASGTVTTEAKDETAITFTGLSVGDATVEIGGVTYTIHVTKELPANALTADTITLEHWITNGRVAQQSGTSGDDINVQTISNTIDNVQTDDGVALDTLSFNPGYWNKNTPVYFWKGVRLDSEHKQTDENGVDRTAEGTDITHIRYLDGAWQYKTADDAWHYFVNTDQLVAYYLQKTTVTKEVETYVKDWGYGTSGTTYPNPEGQVALTVAVVYPDGTVSPAESGMYAKSTTIFNYWNNRDIGIIAPKNNSDYNISKITVTNGSRKENTSKNEWYTNDSITWDKKTTAAGGKWYDEKEVWNKSSGTTPMVNGKASNITWPAKSTAKLVLIYLEPVVKTTNLNIVYWDDTANRQINPNTIQISMAYNRGDAEPTYTTALKNGIGQPIGSKTSWSSNVDGDENYLPNDAYVVNSSNVHQTISKDMTQIEGIAGNYTSGLYEYRSADISTDGKTLTLHYGLKNTGKKTYVVDFGLPVTIPLSDLGINNTSSISWISLKQEDKECLTDHGTYGAATIDKNHWTVTYTLDQTLDNEIAIPINIKFTNSNEIESFSFHVIPATSVYYEDSFATFTNADKSNGVDQKPGNGYWTTDGETVTDAEQALEALGSEKNVYGYDDAYANCNTFSMGSATKVTVDANTANNGQWPTAAFTFKGTGFDVISLTNSDAGTVVYTVTNKSTGKSESHFINNYYGYAYVNGQWVVTNKDTTAPYQVPVIKVSGLAYDTYEVKISVVYGAAFDENKDNQYSFWLDAIRVYDPAGDALNDEYAGDGENAPNYVEVKKVILDTGALENKGAVGAVFIDGKGADGVTAADYKSQGPNHEAYLAQNQAIAFQLTANGQPSSVQIGAKLANGTSAKLSITGANCDKATNGSLTLNTATDMYYELTGLNWTQADGTYKSNVITLTNTSDDNDIVSLTNVKFIGAKYSNELPSAKDTEDEATVVTFAASAAMVDEAVSAVDGVLNPAPQVFAPSRFEASWGHAVRKGDAATLTVKASEDVDSITVDGQTITAYVTKTERTGWGWWAKTVTYREFTYQVAAEETTDYTICAVNSAGVSSDPITATLTVRPSVRDWWHGIFDKWF